jgi:F-type H+-transporting ATPase subunit b
MEGLGFNLAYMLIFGINFVVLLVLLKKVAYKPIIDKLDERADMARETVENAENMRQEMARAEESVKAQIEAGRKEGQAIVAQAADIGERVKTEAREEARREAEALIARARAEINKERTETLDELRREFVDITILAAQRVIDESLDRMKHQRLIEQVLEEGMASEDN